MNKDNFVILDIEVNVPENLSVEKHFHVIQIGATKITNGDFDNYNVFNRYVKPVDITGYVAGAKLTDFIMELTKINQAQVDNGVPFPVAWAEFLTFCAPHFEFLARWGEYDWDVLKRVCEFYDLSFPFRYHVNLKGYYKTYFNDEKTKLGFGVPAALKFFGLPYNEEGHHNGLEDAKMITAIAKAMAERAFETFRKTPHKQLPNWTFAPCERNEAQHYVNPILVKRYERVEAKKREMERLLFYK